MRFSKFLPVFIFTGVALTYPIPNDARGFLDGLSSLFGGGGGGGSSETTPDTKTVAPLGASPRTLRASNPPTKDDVVKSITNWGTSVNTVNQFLNLPSPVGAPRALSYAEDEPIQLGTLMKVPGLSPQGVAAGMVLAKKFPSIPANLKKAIKLQEPLPAAAIKININRCCTVLPAINTLWQASAAAMAMAPPGPVEFEKACAIIKC